MSDGGVKTQADFILPPNIISKVDISHLVSEVERVDNEMIAAEVRKKTGGGDEERPAMSDQLNDFLQKNELNLDDINGRSALIKELRQLKEKVPVIHMTFAVPTDPESLQQLTAWVRESVHKQAVIDIGLQPALVGGVYLRTPNKVHDMSLRGIFDGQRDKLIQELEGLRGLEQ